MQKKFEMNRTKIKGCCQSGRNVVTHNFKSDLPLEKQGFYASLINEMHISPAARKSSFDRASSAYASDNK